MNSIGLYQACETKRKKVRVNSEVELLCGAVECATYPYP